MPGATVPQILYLYEQWFWFAILAALLVVLLFVRKEYLPPFPRIGACLARQQKRIVRTMDSLIIAAVVLSGGLCLFLPLREMVRALSAPQPIRAMAIQAAWSFGLIAMIFWSGIVAWPIGALSIFYSHLTKRKRIFLLFLCLLPPALAVLALATVPADLRWSMIQLGAIACVPGWVVNGPPILVGQHVTDFLRRIMCKLRLISSDSSS